MEPEIARRCSACGASVRGNAFFCPQCGKTLKARTDSASSTVEAPARRRTDAGLKAPIIDPSKSAPAANPSEMAPAQENFAREAGAERIQHAEAVVTRASVDDDDGGSATSKRQRMTAAARDVVEEKLSPRVEKLRQASNVMLEEASYDPSLRFVLVAVAVILLSLLLLLLNHLIG